MSELDILLTRKSKADALPDAARVKFAEQYTQICNQIEVLQHRLPLAGFPPDVAATIRNIYVLDCLMIECKDDSYTTLISEWERLWSGIVGRYYAAGQVNFEEVGK